MVNRKEYMKQYMKKYMIKWKEKNKDYHKKYWKSYYPKNKEKINKNSKIYGKSNRERITQRIKLWRKDNPDKIKKIRQTYRKKYPERHRAHEYARKYQRGDECLICGINISLHFHHIDYEANMGCTLCIEHHQEQTNFAKRHSDEQISSLLVQSERILKDLKCQN